VGHVAPGNAERGTCTGLREPECLRNRLETQSGESSPCNLRRFRSLLLYVRFVWCWAEPAAEPFRPVKDPFVLTFVGRGIEITGDGLPHPLYPDSDEAEVRRARLKNPEISPSVGKGVFPSVVTSSNLQGTAPVLTLAVPSSRPRTSTIGARLRQLRFLLPAAS